MHQVMELGQMECVVELFASEWLVDYLSGTGGERRLKSRVWNVDKRRRFVCAG